MKRCTLTWTIPVLGLIHCPLWPNIKNQKHHGCCCSSEFCCVLYHLYLGVASRPAMHSSTLVILANKPKINEANSGFTPVTSGNTLILQHVPPSSTPPRDAPTPGEMQARPPSRSTPPLSASAGIHLVHLLIKDFFSHLYSLLRCWKTKIFWYINQCFVSFIQYFFMFHFICHFFICILKSL